MGGGGGWRNLLPNAALFPAFKMGSDVSHFAVPLTVDGQIDRYLILLLPVNCEGSYQGETEGIPTTSALTVEDTVTGQSTSTTNFKERKDLLVVGSNPSLGSVEQEHKSLRTR